MENNKSEFKATGVYFDGARKYEIQIARSGDVARYRMTVKYVVRGCVVTQGRWQKIRYSKRQGSAYITMYGKRIYLYKFRRIY